MSASVVWWRSLVAGSIVLCVALAVGASGQGARPQSTFGTVDVQRINQQFKARQVALSDLTAMQATLQGRLTRRQNMPFLTDEEHRQLDTHVEKGAAQTDADRAAARVLTDKATQLNTEFEQLSQKPDAELTAEDRTKIQERRAAGFRMQQNVGVLNEQFTNQMREFESTNLDRLMKEFRDAVKKVAEQRNLTIVFDSQFALYAGTDITAPVLAELNRT
ncbi:MAG TPA: OmpH family outer membrane protein [Chthonomonadales bacterium]|nr:OmpH family outer membrane protein [Chthonomonadales bacterium]